MQQKTIRALENYKDYKIAGLTFIKIKKGRTNMFIFFLKSAQKSAEQKSICKCINWQLTGRRARY